MAGGWIKVAPGIRCRDHPRRQHGVRPDRYFTLRFSMNGRQTEEALGWASQGWTLGRAQEELGKLRAAKRTGEGPASLRERAAAQRRAEQQHLDEEAALARRRRTVADLWDRYSKEVVAVANKPSTIAAKARMWKQRIEPAIGALKIEDVTEEDVGTVVRAPLRLDAAGRAVAGKAQAGNLYRLLRHMFRKALGWGLRPRALGNPLDNVAEPKVPRRERLLNGAEISALLKALDAANLNGTEIPQVIAAIRAVVFTGARISELLNLQWEHVRRDEMEIHFPDTKSGFSRRPMSTETLSVFESIQRTPGAPFIFRFPKDPSKPLPYHVVEKAFGRIVSAAGVKNCSLHTIRHWFATMTANSISNPRVGMVLTGHKSYAAYLNYIHADKEQARSLAEQLAAFAKALGTQDTNVVALPAPHTAQGQPLSAGGTQP